MSFPFDGICGGGNVVGDVNGGRSMVNLIEGRGLAAAVKMLKGAKGRIVQPWMIFGVRFAELTMA